MIVRGCEKFVPALAYLFCPALPGSCLVRFAYIFADLCTYPVGGSFQISNTLNSLICSWLGKTLLKVCGI